MRLLATALIAFAGLASAQTQTQTQEPAQKERRTLNLRLDNPSSFATNAPAEKEAAKALPTLGGDARKIAPVEGSREASAIPKDTNPTR